jgi:phage baseplate assembly protein W
MNIRTSKDRWAYDIDKNPIDQGEIWDREVINQSIEMILGTMYGERLFNPAFGFGLQYRIFESMSSAKADRLLDEIAIAIRTWEDRITLIESEMRIIANVDNNSVVLLIPYIVNINNIKSVFKKKIVSN